MELSNTQRDALTEIANIGVSRAAKQLSLLLGDDIEMHVPSVAVTSLSNVPEMLPETGQDHEVVSVVQLLQGYISGRAMLMFHSEESRALAHALVGNVPMLTGTDMRAFEHEAVTEIGNIIISSCISIIADILGEEIALSVPAYGEDTLANLIRQDWPELVDDMQVVVLQANLRAAYRDVTGKLLIVLTLQSLETLLERVDEFIRKHSTRQ